MQISKLIAKNCRFDIQICMDRLGDLDWNYLRAFWATAETGSLSAAARSLKLTQPTLSRQVAALEQSIGLLLFERAGRTITLTQAGVELLEHTKDMAEAANRVALAASGQSHKIEGLIRITASDVLSAYMMPGFMRELRDVAPDLQVEIVATNTISDLMRREADIAIRHVRPEQPDLVARLVKEAEGQFYASTNYLDKHGRPSDKADLSHHDFVGFGNPQQMIDYLEPLGISLTARNFRLGSENGIAAWEFVKHGFGLGPMSTDVGDATPGIERALPAMEPILFPVWLVTHREVHTSRRIRLVFDMLADFLKR